MTDSSDDWRNRASCQDEDPELFFPNAYTDYKGTRTAEAKACCWSCPVRRQCLRFGMPFHFGIYGGRTPEERDVLRQRLAAMSA